MEQRRKKRRCAGTEMSARAAAWGEEAKVPPPPSFPLSLHNHGAFEEDIQHGERRELWPPLQLILSAGLGGTSAANDRLRTAGSHYPSNRGQRHLSSTSIILNYTGGCDHHPAVTGNYILVTLINLSCAPGDLSCLSHTRSGLSLNWCTGRTLLPRFHEQICFSFEGKIPSIRRQLALRCPLVAVCSTRHTLQAGMEKEKLSEGTGKRKTSSTVMRWRHRGPNPGGQHFHTGRSGAGRPSLFPSTWQTGEQMGSRDGDSPAFLHMGGLAI